MRETFIRERAQARDIEGESDRERAGERERERHKVTDREKK